MNKNAVDFPAGYSYLATILWFLGGAVITALFSGSLAVLAHDIDPVEVLIVGMIVPSFTWVVQFSASMIGLSVAQRRLYWGDLSRVCLVGSVALLPVGFLNLCLSQPTGRGPSRTIHSPIATEDFGLGAGHEDFSAV